MMTAPVTTLPAPQPRSVTIDMAARFGMEPQPFEQTVRALCLPPDRDGRQATREEFAAFLLVAKQYELNPLLKEIYGFRAKNGAIVPVVSVDGWANIINKNSALDGIEFDDHMNDEGNLSAITCRIWRKDRAKPTVVTEYMAECRRDPEKTPWGKWPRRMLRHKALIQCSRYAFGFSGIVDPDEAERMGADVSPMRDVTPTARAAEPPPPPRAPRPRPVEQIAPPVEEEAQQGTQEEVVQEEVVQEEAQGQPPPEGVNEQSWLNDVEGALSGCETLGELGETTSKVMAPQKGIVSAQTWERAQRLAEDTYFRIARRD